MNSRKTIAIVVGTPEGFYRGKSLSGIIKQAKHLGYNVAAMCAFTLTDERSKHQVGEENVYQLLRNKNIVGAVLVGYSFWASKAKEELFKLLSEIPDFNMVIIDDEDTNGYKGIMADDRKGFAEMTDHLIEAHGYKKIMCLTGMKEYDVSHVRMNGYLDSMKRHGLEVPEGYAIFGDFWTMAATEVAEKIANGTIERPDAVICGNDKSAVTMVNELIARGVNVPEDVAVCGYDFGEDSILNNPTVTTCTRPDIYVGELCVCKLHENYTGEKCEPLDEQNVFFISGDSCGCRRDMSFSHTFNEIKRKAQESESNYRFSCMQEVLMASETYDELIYNLCTKLYMLRDADAYVLCLNNEWNKFEENDNVFIRTGYSKDMFEAVAWVREKGERKRVYFNPDDLFPPDILNGDEPTACFFNVVHFEDRCFGYEVVRFTDEINSAPEDIYHNWTSSLSVALEYIRMQERMQLMYNRVFANSVRDGMTGLYNRQGYQLYSKDVFALAKQKHFKLLVAAVDLDGLKMINDNYGHSEGDNAITVVARAVQTCCGNGEYCVRTGGDEFVIFGTYVGYDNETLNFYKSRINGYLDRYNQHNDKPYPVEASVGFFLDYVDNYKDIDQCAKIADERMYADKTARKKHRVN